MSEQRRLDPLPEDRFCFQCGPEVSCFTECCAKLNLQLTPYDIVRLARRLEISTTEFLDKYITAIEEPGKVPRVQLLMNEDDSRCPFVTDKGCTLYEDRPAACRTYPLARASAPGKGGGPTRVAYFVIKEKHCKGFDSEREWRTEDWVSDQEIVLYNELNDLWMEIVTRQGELMESTGVDQKVGMFNLASYDLDGFRNFVFNSGLLKRVDLRKSLIEQLKTDDVKLLRFSMAWLHLALFGEVTPALTQP